MMDVELQKIIRIVANSIITIIFFYLMRWNILDFMDYLNRPPHFTPFAFPTLSVPSIYNVAQLIFLIIVFLVFVAFCFYLIDFINKKAYKYISLFLLGIYYSIGCIIFILQSLLYIYTYRALYVEHYSLLISISNILLVISIVLGLVVALKIVNNIRRREYRKTLKTLLTAVFFFPLIIKFILVALEDSIFLQLEAFCIAMAISFVLISREKFFNSFAINCFYGLTLLLISSFIIHTLNSINILWALIIIFLYYIIELRLLFFKNALEYYPTRQDWRSWPTLCILILTPITSLYIMLFMEKLLENKSIKEKLFTVWAITRHLILEPYWFRQEADDEEISRRLIYRPIGKDIFDLFIDKIKFLNIFPIKCSGVKRINELLTFFLLSKLRR